MLTSIFKKSLIENNKEKISNLKSLLYEKLGITTVFASPYNARAKVIERFSTLNVILRSSLLIEEPYTCPS